jgi:hypothetical protein
MISRYIIVLVKVYLMQILSRIHKADSTEGGKKCEACIGHQQGDRASDEVRVQTFASRQKGLVMKK